MLVGKILRKVIDSFSGNKIKIIIYGINQHSIGIDRFIKNRARIVGFTDDNIVQCSSSGVHKIIPLDYILKGQYSYDYIVVAKKTDVSNLAKIGIRQDKIVDIYSKANECLANYQEFYQQNYFYSFLYFRMKKLEQRDDYKIIITGLSYSLYGVVEELLKHKSIKLTIPSQDLYYDNAFLQRVSSFNKSAKYCIWGIAYYSFEYDLRYSADNTQIGNIYYPLLGDSHGAEMAYDCLPPQELERLGASFPSDIFTESYYTYAIEEIFETNITPEHDEQMWNNLGDIQGKLLSSFDEEERKRRAIQRLSTHNKYDFPITREKNQQIMRGALAAMQRCGIKPILVVFPTTEYYKQNFCPQIKERFYSIVRELRREFEFQFIDMMHDNKLDLDDFADWDHLNKIGATKVTSQLNELIEW